jgi:hypothetical protein
VIVCAAIVFLGLNIGLGGIKTLGWQTTRDFVVITDAAIFHAQDSHIRFIGGIWFGIGATFLIGGFAMRTFRPTLIILSAMIAIAGLLRMSDIDSGVIFSAAIAPSIMLELFGSPLLAWRLVMSKNQKTKADG